MDHRILTKSLGVDLTEKNALYHNILETIRNFPPQEATKHIVEAVEELLASRIAYLEEDLDNGGTTPARSTGKSAIFRRVG